MINNKLFKIKDDNGRDLIINIDNLTFIRAVNEGMHYQLDFIGGESKRITYKEFDRFDRALIEASHEELKK